MSSKKLIILAMMLLLSNCAQSTKETNIYCYSFHDITISKHDKLTGETAKEILANNHTYDVLCK